MGTGDSISSTTDSIKRNAPDLTSVKGLSWSSYDSIKRNAPDPTSLKGLYWSSYDTIKRIAPDPTSVKGLYWSSYDTIKRNAPDLTSVWGFCPRSYDYSRAAVIIIHNAIRVNTVDKIYPYLPDVETLSEIATNLAKKTATVAVREGAKLVPGGSTVYDIVSQSIPGKKKAKEYKEDLRECKDKARKMETEQDRTKHELNNCKRLLEQHEMHRLIMELTLGLNRKPEDAIRFFTKPEVTGKQYLDDLIAPGVKPK